MNRFIDRLLEKGYNINIEHFSGGFSGNQVSLLNVYKGEEKYQYVMKSYKEQESMEKTLEGYSIISPAAKMSPIIYSDISEKVIVYDYIKGENIEKLLKEKNPLASIAIKYAAKNLCSLHKRYMAESKTMSSEDKEKIVKHAHMLKDKGLLSEEDSQRILDEIRYYKPKQESYIHGDTHAKNFIYSEGTVYVIDPDECRKSDPHADVERFIDSVARIASESGYQKHEQAILIDIIKDSYGIKKEEEAAIMKLRGPLLESKNGRMNKKELHGLVDKYVSEYQSLQLLKT